jgi:hypothetical protein
MFKNESDLLCWILVGLKIKWAGDGYVGRVFLKKIFFI